MKRTHSPAFTLRLLGFLLSLTFCTGWAKAESFKVLHFHSDITLNLDGSFDVVEDILLEFSESRHGFIRQLPYRYAPAPNVQGEIAEGHTTGVEYLTPITGISVEGKEYTVTKGSKNYEIKIGSADVTVTGRQAYRIRYKVYGAINFFSKNSEFYWNVNGNDWDVDFDSLDATVHLPTSKKMAKADLQVFTGAFGATLGGAATIATPGEVQFLGTRRFGPHEGMTIVVRMPKGYLRHDPVPLSARADVFFIDSLHAALQLASDGSIMVQETLRLDIVSPQRDVVLHFDPFYRGSLVDGAPEQNVRIEYLDCRSLTGNFDARVYAHLSADEYLPHAQHITIPANVFPEAGKYTMILKYRIWGATANGKTGAVCHIPFFAPDDDAPLAYAKVDLNWKDALPIDLKNVGGGLNIPADNKLVLQANRLSLEFLAPFNPGERIHFRVQFPGKKLNIAPTPVRILSPEQYITYYHVDYDIRADGMVHITNTFGYYEYNWYDQPERPLMLHYQEPSEVGLSMGKPQVWGHYGHYLVCNLDYKGEMMAYAPQRDHGLRLAIRKKIGEEGVDTMRYSYDIFGILWDSAGTKWLNFPLVETLEEPADHVDFTIHFPGGGLLNAQDILTWVTPTGEMVRNPTIRYDFKPGLVSGELPNGMENGQLLLLKLRLPEGAVSSSLWLRMQLTWANHKIVFFPLFLFVPLFLIWFLKGRDRRFTKVVQFYPPEELTPAEAGMLIDDKLHNRDLLALIYYWGAQGLISISEIYDKDGNASDYEFLQLKKLPTNARKYEKTIFNALFATEKRVKLSSHNQKFATTMATARTELNAYVKAKNFYVPGTMGWAMGIRIVGILIAIIAIVSFAMVFFRFSWHLAGRWDIPLGWGGCAALLLGFAKIMPKKAGFGQQQYEKLVGFQEFVLRAEKDKLEELVHTNPDYFGMTLPYAIALGIATKWVANFGGLLTAPPSYYHANNTVLGSDYWQRHQFDLILQRQLNQMSQNFNSTTPAPSGGGSSSGSSYSSSSSSYSSSGSSGGSSYSSGGGYSGGGYGGGGGSSW